MQDNYQIEFSWNEAQLNKPAPPNEATQPNESTKSNGSTQPNEFFVKVFHYFRDMLPFPVPPKNLAGENILT